MSGQGLWGFGNTFINPFHCLSAAFTEPHVGQGNMNKASNQVVSSL